MKLYKIFGPCIVMIFATHEIEKRLKALASISPMVCYHQSSFLIIFGSRLFKRFMDRMSAILR